MRPRKRYIRARRTVTVGRENRRHHKFMRGLDIHEIRVKAMIRAWKELPNAINKMVKSINNSFKNAFGTPDELS
jgi:hypothetical protein